MSALELGLKAVERHLVPDAVTRLAIRRLCRERLRQSARVLQPADGLSPARTAFLDSLRSGPIAHVPEAANEQHYELPAEFFQAVLGPHLKYSCCCFDSPQATLADAEAAALRITCERAQLRDGQTVLELGCGWGSLSLWMAEHYPQSRITAVSNSRSQRAFIEAEAQARGLSNLQIITADMNDFSPAGQQYDRVVSVEMFEHMRNYQSLLSRISTWLRPDGKLFVHVFCHREYCYPFETDGAANWMGRYFFTGGLMPSQQLLSEFDSDLRVTEQYCWNGQHYQRTAEAWLGNLDARRRDVLRCMQKVYGPRDARLWLNRWRLFFLAVAELFGFAGGEEWFVSHYLLERSEPGVSSGSPTCP